MPVVLCLLHARRVGFVPVRGEHLLAARAVAGAAAAAVVLLAVVLVAALVAEAVVEGKPGDLQAQDVVGRLLVEKGLVASLRRGQGQEVVVVHRGDLLDLNVHEVAPLVGS